MRNSKSRDIKFNYKDSDSSDPIVYFRIHIV